MYLTYYHFYNPKNYLYSKPTKGLKVFEQGYGFSFNGKENDNETQTQDYGMRIYDYRLGRFLSVDPLTSKYPFLTPYQFSSNRPIDGADLDGLEYDPNTFNRLINNGKTKLTNYVTNKTVDLVTSAMSSIANYFKDNVEVTYFAKIEFKATVGGRAALKLDKITGGDLNLGSVELVSFSGELNLKTKKITGNLNYLNKDNKILFTQNVSATYGTVAPVPVGIGGGKGTEDERKGNKTISEKKSANVGVGVGIMNFTATGEKKEDKKTGESSTTATLSSGVAESIGVGVVFDAKVEVGSRIEVKN
ncbi:MAG: RHS repeat-associated core domain-containing protein [Bacteroidia bacterium]